MTCISCVGTLPAEAAVHPWSAEPAGPWAVLSAWRFLLLGGALGVSCDGPVTSSPLDR